MVNLSEWSFARVLLVSVAWIILVVGWQILQIYLLFRRMRSESNGIGAVSFGISGPVSILIGPPVLLLVVWLVLSYLRRT